MARKKEAESEEKSMPKKEKNEKMEKSTKTKNNAKVSDTTKKRVATKNPETKVDVKITAKKVTSNEKTAKKTTAKKAMPKKATAQQEASKKIKIEKKATSKKEESIEDIALEEKEEISSVPVEEVSIQEIKQTIKKKQNLPKEEVGKINKCVFQNILVSLCIIIYFIFLNLGHMNIQGEVYVTDLKVFSMCILLLAIALIEKAYKKDDGKMAIYGIEMIVLSIVTVALIYVNLMLSTRYVYIVTAISYIFAIYYLIKSIVIYVRRRKKYFVDNMKEIINNKDE